MTTPNLIVFLYINSSQTSAGNHNRSRYVFGQEYATDILEPLIVRKVTKSQYQQKSHQNRQPGS